MSAPIVQKEAEALAADAVRACAHGADADAQGRPPRLTGGSKQKAQMSRVRSKLVKLIIFLISLLMAKAA